VNDEKSNQFETNTLLFLEAMQRSDMRENEVKFGVERMTTQAR